MSDTFYNGQTLTAEDLNNMINDIERLKLYQTRIKPGSSQDNLPKAGSLIGGLGVTGEKASYTNDQGSLAFGEGLITYRENEVAFGCYNKTSDPNENIVFSIGNGSGNSQAERSNLFSISSDGIVKIKENILATTSYVDTIRDNINNNIQTLKENTIANYDTRIKQLETDVGGLNTNLIGFKSEYFYPVGSVYTSTKNLTANQIAITLGKGVWQLIDKEFNSTNQQVSQGDISKYLTSVPQTIKYNDNKNIIDVANNVKCDQIYWMAIGHSIRIRLRFTISQSLAELIKTENILANNSIIIGKLNLSAFGMGSTDANSPIQFTQSLLSIPIVSDDGNCLFMCNINYLGQIELTDYIDRAIGTIKDNIVNTSIKPDDGIQCYINFDILCKPNQMADSACNKFYYERTE